MGPFALLFLLYGDDENTVSHRPLLYHDSFAPFQSVCVQKTFAKKREETKTKTQKSISHPHTHNWSDLTGKIEYETC